MNTDLFNKITPPSDWGRRKVLKIPPNKSKYINGLKPICYCVWLLSLDAIDGISDASELVVIWLGDSPEGKTIEETISNGVEGVDWKKKAQDFDFL